jgi:hypothetical protein
MYPAVEVAASQKTSEMDDRAPYFCGTRSRKDAREKVKALFAALEVAWKSIIPKGR